MSTLAKVEPYIDQICNLVLWIHFFYFPPPISIRVNIITPLEKLSGNIKNSQKVQKGVYQFVKISFTKKTTTDFRPDTHFLDLKQLFLIFPLNFFNGVIIFTLIDIGRGK